MKNMSKSGVTLAFAAAIAIGTAFNASAQSLLNDKQMVTLTFTSGPASKVQGSGGKGKFSQGLDAAAGIFGPAKVLHHSASELRFKGKVDDCKLKADKTVSCKSGSKGTWR